MSNPFSTRFIRPGAVPFIFPSGVTVEMLVQRLEQQNWRGAIVGPHGSGKSTLLETLIPAIEQVGRRVLKIVLHDGQRRLPTDFSLPVSGGPPYVVIVDGYEQLGWWARRKLNSICQRSDSGLLVTLHSSPARYGLRELYLVQPKFEMFQQVVERLLKSADTSICPDDLTTAYEAHQHNMREALFELYDLIEKKSRKGKIEKE